MKAEQTQHYPLTFVLSCGFKVGKTQTSWAQNTVCVKGCSVCGGDSVQGTSGTMGTKGQKRRQTSIREVICVCGEGSVSVCRKRGEKQQ